MVVPVAVTVTPLAGADPPFAITLETVAFPGPAKVKRRGEAPELRSIPPLKTIPPPATEDVQVGFPPSMITLLPKVWIAAELLMMPATDPTVMPVPVHV
jgi:hypothetical protein